MEENVFGSVDDIDAKLDEEFAKDVAEPEQETDNAALDTTQGNEEIIASEDIAEKEQESDEDTEEKPQENDEGKSESKKDHAFAELRTQNNSLRKERDEYKADSEYLKELAASYGYDDVKKFQEDVRITRYQKEAQEKGYDETLYRKYREQELRIAELEKKNQEEITQRQLEKFQTALSNASKTYDIDEKEILNRLEDEGITVDEILSSNNHKLLINGVLIDEIKNSAKQKEIENLQNIKSLAEDKNEQGTVSHTVTIESLLKDDLAKYKKDNFYE